MSEDNKGKKEQNTDINFNLTFINEHLPEFGKTYNIVDYRPDFQYTVYKSVTVPDINFSLEDFGIDTDYKEIVVPYTFNLSDYYEDTNGFDFTDFKDKYEKGNYSSPYQCLTSFINENKSKPEYLTKSISNFLSYFSNLYDSDKNYTEIGNSQQEIMDKIMQVQEGGKLKGFICMTIHEFMMKTLNDCGIDAVTLCGGTDSSNHATLLYQLEKGKYIWNNYDTNIVVEASNIKEAMGEIYKKSGSLYATGYYDIIDGKTSYHEFALEREAAFGDKMDKRDYQNLTPFDNKPENNCLRGNAEISTLGNIRAAVSSSLNISKPDKNSWMNLGIEYKKNNTETDIMLNSQSTGLDVGYHAIKNKNTKNTFFNINLTTAYTQGLTGNTTTYNTSETSQKLFNAIQAMKTDIFNQTGETVDLSLFEITPNFSFSNKEVKQQLLSHFININGGVSSKLYSTKDISVEHAFQTSLLGGMTFNLNSSAFTGDYRILSEEALKLHAKKENMKFENVLGTGIGLDLKKTGGAQKSGISPVLKFNAGSGLEFNNNKTSAGANVRAYSTITKPSKDMGIEGNISVQVKPDNSNISFFGNAKAVVERQKLTIGGFNERTENNVQLGTTIGATFKNKSTVYFNTTINRDKLNPTKNYSTFSAGCKILF